MTLFSIIVFEGSLSTLGNISRYPSMKPPKKRIVPLTLRRKPIYNTGKLHMSVLIKKYEDGWSISELSRQTKKSPKTLKKILKEKRIPHSKNLLTQEEEEQLVKWIEDRQDHRFPVTKMQVLQAVSVFPPSLFTFLGSRDCFY